jgi:nucleotide-binding universal stress UspA family protein
MTNELRTSVPTGLAPIVVAVGGSDASSSATSWGAAEAEHRQLPLRLVHVVGWPYVGVGDAPALEPRAAAVEMAEAVLAEAAAHARHGVPGLQPLTETLWGSVGPMLLDETAHAHTLVLGRGSRSGYGNTLTGSAVPALAAHAACTVVAVPEAPSGDWRTGRPRVVVAFDGSPSSHAALDYAKDVATTRAADIEVVRVEPRADDGSGDRLSGLTAGLDTDALTGMKFRTIRAQPVEALVAAAAAADLLVVGCRGRALEDPMGSVGRGVIYHARCPVAIVPPPTRARTVTTLGK